MHKPFSHLRARMSPDAQQHSRAKAEAMLEEMPGDELQTAPEDYLRFGRGAAFDPKRVCSVLGLDMDDVWRIAGISAKSVRYDGAIPERVRECLEEIASTVNLVAQFFEGDIDKTLAWFKARNPMLGDISPQEMIRLGRYARLHRFIVSATRAQALSGSGQQPR